MDRLKAYSIERINGRFKKNKHLEWSDTSCLFSEIERLKKENEWLMDQLMEYVKSDLGFNHVEVKKYVIGEMHQALKED